MECQPCRGYDSSAFNQPPFGLVACAFRTRYSAAMKTLLAAMLVVFVSPAIAGSTYKPPGYWNPSEDACFSGVPAPPLALCEKYMTHAEFVKAREWEKTHDPDTGEVRK